MLSEPVTRVGTRRLVGPMATALRVAAPIVLSFGFFMTWGCDSREGSSTRGAEGLRANGVPLASGALADHNVLIITLDTVRADRLGCYGYERAETPHLDSLAARGVRFADAITPVPITLPSHSSIFTGLTPPSHGARLNGVHLLAPEHETLAETLSREGWQTAAFVAASVLDRTRGLNQGFEVYDDRFGPGGTPARGSAERPADAVTDAAVRWLAGRDPDRPFLLWAHYFDAHDPYEPPMSFAGRFGERLYDGEIAFVDQEIGRLLDALAGAGLGANTLVVVTADHGEGLGDHGEKTHAHLIYELTMHVPLIVVPGDRLDQAHLVDDRVVSLCDITPTVLDALGIPAPIDAGSLDGRSLLDDRPHAPPTSDRAVYMETLWPHLMHGWAPIYALRRHGDKFIGVPIPEYYELSGDPHELANRLGEDRPATISEMPEAAAELKVELDARVAAQDAVQSKEDLDPETIERLMSLGYIMGDGTDVATPDTVTPEPLRVMIERWQARSDSILSSPQLQVENMLQMQLRSVALNPTDDHAHHDLGRAYMQLKRFADAQESFSVATQLNPEVADYWLGLAESQGARNLWDAFDSSMAEARRLDPDSYVGYMLQGRREAARGRWADALEAFERARDVATPEQRRSPESWIGRMKRRLSEGG